MGINTLTPRYLNLDNDSRIIAAQEMVDALNVRVSADEGGDQGVVKNIAGNSVVGNNLGYSPLISTNKIVGCYEHEGTNRFFVFIHNSVGQHTIYRLGQGESSFTKIIESGNFKLSGEPLHIDGMMVDGDLHLYFTDGVEEPQKLNVDTTLAVGTYPSSVTESAVMKLAPTAPTVAYSTDSARSTNELLGKSFQFAFQYVFRDGEVSAIGEYSDNTVAANTLNDLFADQDYNSEFNKITIGINPPVGLGLGSTIPNIRVFFRDVYDNTMFYVGEYTYLEIFNGLDFYNDESYSVVSDAEFNKTQDAVPKTAQAQTISANRLFYGNYTEGFDKEDISATLATNFGLEFSEYSLPETADAGTLDNTVVLNTDNVAAYINGVDDVEFVLDFAVDKYRWTEGASKTIDIKNVSGTTTLDTTPSGNVNFEIPRTRYYKGGSVSAPTSQADYCTKLAAAINGLEVTKTFTSIVVDQYSGSPYPVWTINWSGSVTQKLVATATATTVELEVVVTDYSVNSTDIEKNDGTGAGSVAFSGSAATSESNASGISGSVMMFSIYRQGSFAFLTQVERTFKAGESHSFGIVLEDQFGRTSGVYELGSIAVPTLGERSAGERGVAHIDITPSATINNAEFTQYFFVYSGGNTIEDYIQYSVAEALLVDGAQTVDTDVSDSDNNIYLPLRTLQGKSNSYNANNDLEYSFSEGDRLRVISYVDGGERVYPQGMEWDISSIYTQDTAGVFGSINTSIATGDFLVIENNEDYDGFAITDIQGATNLWESDVVVEIYTPKKANATKIYKAIEGKYPIADINTLRTITQGNAWNKRRNLKFGTTGSGLTNDVIYVESKQYSDSDALTKGFLGGKPYGVINSEREQNRVSSITYSDPQLADSAQNNLSSFNNSLGNFADYEMNYGGIYGLVDSSDSITVLQSDKVSRVPVSRNILATATGTEFVTQSTNVLGLQQHFGGNFGINEDRTAFLKADGTVYLVDVTRSKLVALTQGGVKILSDMNVSSYVEERCNEMLADADGYYVSIGYDKINNEIIFSLQNKPITNTKSLVYSTGLDKFTSFVNYTSTFYGTLGNRFLQMRGDDVYEAETNPIYGQFFGLQYDAYIKAVFNQNPTARKVFNAIGVDGTANPSATLSTIDQSVSMPEGAFSLREGVYYGNVPREEGTSQFVMLGAVRSENDPEITFEAKVNRLPFRLGGEVFKLDGGVMTAIAGVTADSIVSSRVVSMSNGGAVTAGDVIGVKGASVDGDPLRGAYAEVQLDFNDAIAFELFSITAHTSESGLHNNPQTQQ